MPAYNQEFSVRCPACGAQDTRVTCSKWNEAGDRIRRYRKCNECGHTFRTTQPQEFLDMSGSFFNTGVLPQNEQSGEANPNAFFTVKNVQDIRQAYEAGRLNQRELAKLYGCAQQTISNILRRKTWAHVH